MSPSWVQVFLSWVHMFPTWKHKIHNYQNTFSIRVWEMFLSCQDGSCSVPGVRIFNKVGMLKVC